MGAVVVGAGFIGGVHCRAIRAAGARLVGVADRNQGRADDFGDRFAAPHVTADAGDLLRMPDVDVVHICTPNATHAALAAQALEAGKHVVCEKPLATSLADATELGVLADRSGAVAAVPFVYRFYPMVREMRARVRLGMAGPLNLVHGTYLQDWLSRPTDSDWRVQAGSGGPSRAFGDIGVHWADLMEFVSGHRITAVSAQLSMVFPERGTGDGQMVKVDTEDLGVVCFRTDGGALGSVVLSQLAHGRKNRFQLNLDGAGASFTFDHDQPDVLWVGDRDAAHVLQRSADNLSPGAAKYAVLPPGHPHGYQDCFNAFVKDCYAAIGGDPPEGLPSFADGLRAAQVTQAVLDAARTGAWVDVPAPPSRGLSTDVPREGPNDI